MGARAHECSQSSSPTPRAASALSRLVCLAHCLLSAPPRGAWCRGAALHSVSQRPCCHPPIAAPPTQRPGKISSSVKVTEYSAQPAGARAAPGIATRPPHMQRCSSDTALACARQRLKGSCMGAVLRAGRKSIVLGGGGRWDFHGGVLGEAAHESYTKVAEKLIAARPDKLTPHDPGELRNCPKVD